MTPILRIISMWPGEDNFTFSSTFMATTKMGDDYKLLQIVILVYIKCTRTNAGCVIEPAASPRGYGLRVPLSAGVAAVPRSLRPAGHPASSERRRPPRDHGACAALEESAPRPTGTDRCPLPTDHSREVCRAGEILLTAHCSLTDYCPLTTQGKRATPAIHLSLVTRR